MIVVTGGAGFIGSAFVSLLNAREMDDILIVDNLAETSKWKNLVNLTYEDYLHKHDFIELLLGGEFEDEIDAIVHLGACSSTTEPDADYLVENNYRYTRHLAEWCLARDIRFIYASSGATYGAGELGFSDDHDLITSLHPVNMYGYSKQMFDAWAFRSGALERIAGLKFFNVFGPNEYHKGEMRSMVKRAFEQINETGVVKLFRSDHPDYKDGGQLRDFIYVKDAAQMMLWLLDNPEANGVFNIGTGEARSWRDLATAVFKAMGLQSNIEYFDMPDKLKGKYQYYTRAEMDKLRGIGCDHVCMSFEDAVADYVTGYLQTEDPYFDPDDWRQE